MATQTKNITFVPLGCSCINQFQLDRKYGTDNYQSQLFDWNIVTPESTIKILNSKKRLFIDSLNDLHIHTNKILSLKTLPGFYFWHLNKFIKEEINLSSIADFEPYFADFKKKHEYQITKFFSIDNKNVVFLWSNAQPNLKLACGNFLDEFILSDSIYENLKEAINN